MRLLHHRKTCFWNDQMSDILDVFDNCSACPNCGAVALIGTLKCPECNAFHSSTHLVERRPTAEDLKPSEPKEINPGKYSLNPDAEIPELSPEQDVEDMTIAWQGGNTDFTFSDDSEVDISELTSNPKRIGSDTGNEQEDE